MQISEKLAKEVIDQITDPAQRPCGYWAVVRPSAAGWFAEEREESVSDNRQRMLLAQETLQRGVDVLTRPGAIALNRDIRASILVAVATDDAGEIDAIAADVLVQAAMFGEIVYG